MKYGYLVTDSDEREHFGIVPAASGEDLLGMLVAAGWNPKQMIEMEENVFGYGKEKPLPQELSRRLSEFVSASKNLGLRRGAYAAEQFEQALRSSDRPSYLERSAERHIREALEVAEKGRIRAEKSRELAVWWKKKCEDFEQEKAAKEAQATEKLPEQFEGGICRRSSDDMPAVSSRSVVEMLGPAIIFRASERTGAR